MIEPELLLVDEITFQRVSNICGPQVAIELCCVDQETAQAVKQMVDIIQGGVRHAEIR